MFEERQRTYQTTLGYSEARKRRDLKMTRLRKEERMQELKRRRGVEYEPESQANFPPVLMTLEHRLFEVGLDIKCKFTLLVGLIERTVDVRPLLGAVKAYRKIIAGNQSGWVAELTTVNLLRKFLRLLTNEVFHREIIWIIINLACFPNHIVEKLVGMGVLDQLAAVVSKGPDAVKLLALWALGNFATESLEVRDFVLGKGLERTVFALLKSEEATESDVETCLWFLQTLCQGAPLPPEEITMEILKNIAKFINVTAEGVLKYVLTIISLITDNCLAAADEVLELTLLPQILRCINSEDSHLASVAIRIAGNFSVFDETYTSVLIENNLLDIIYSLLHSGPRFTKRECLWVLSNLLVDAPKIARKVINHPCMSLILQFMYDPDISLQTELVHCIFNALAHMTAQDVYRLEEFSFLNTLCDGFRIQDTGSLIRILACLERTLKLGNDDRGASGKSFLEEAMEISGNLDRLEQLQMHPNIQVYQAAVWILEEYFSAEMVIENAELLESPAYFGLL